MQIWLFTIPNYRKHSINLIASMMRLLQLQSLARHWVRKRIVLKILQHEKCKSKPFSFFFQALIDSLLRNNIPVGFGCSFSVSSGTPTIPLIIMLSRFTGMRYSVCIYVRLQGIVTANVIHCLVTCKQFINDPCNHFDIYSTPKREST